MDEKVFLDKEGVKVTSARITVGTHTIPVSNVSAVSMEVEKGAVYAGRALVLLGILVMVSGHPQVGAIITGLGLLLMIFSRTEYELKIETAGNRVKVMTEKKKEHVEAVLAAINEAIIARG